MKINLLKVLGNAGMITGKQKVISDKLVLKSGEEGTVMVGKAVFIVKNGEAVIPEKRLEQGTSRVFFTDEDGKIYDCGCLVRRGRYVDAMNPVDKVIASLAIACEAQEKRIKALETELAELRKGYGINIG
jgi:hypothetical protein